MKVALINKVFSLGYGGGERYGVNLAKSLCSKGIEVHLFGIVLEDVPSEAVVHSVTAPVRPGFARVTGFVSHTRPMVQAQDFDIVYSLTQYYPVHVLRVGGGVHKHWMTLRFPGSVHRFFRYLLSPVNLAHLYLELKMYNPKNYQKIITNSNLCKSHVSLYYHVPATSIEVIYTGVDHRIFNPGIREQHRKSQRGVLGLSEEDIGLLFVSNNWKRKGMESILLALALLGKDAGCFKLIGVGKGKKRHFVSMAKKLGLYSQIRFLEPTREIERYYAAADVFVLPTQYDPFSNACLEAMSCGLPVITSRCNGASEIIEHRKNGFIMEHADNVKSLAFYLTCLLDHGARESIGLQAAESVRHLTVERNMDETLNVFKGIMASNFNH
ncbi:MAG TPA: glycosyltransferase family 4 protein [Thermodesulfovibrionia bacterium]|nr:glycosyltransferase family 4 protein [Thermodesulfovibrionia bacterium]